MHEEKDDVLVSQGRVSGKRDGEIEQQTGQRRQHEALTRAGQAIEAALESVLSDPARRTADLGGPLGTRAFGEAVASRL